MQGTGLLGAGYATVSTVNGVADEHSNHYGFAPNAALVLRAIFSERASLDLSGREYFVSNVSGSSRGGHDNVVRADATLTWRVTGRHAIAVKYQYSRRNVDFANVDRSQERGTIGIFYTLLGRDRLAAADHHERAIAAIDLQPVAAPVIRLMCDVRIHDGAVVELTHQHDVVG